MKKHFTAHIIFAATALASQQAWALGFGRSVSDAVLGQSFSFTVPVEVDAGEQLGPDCVSAQVFYGENPLASGAVRTELIPGGGGHAWTVRITVAAPVTEPIVEVALTAGCERRFTRRFSIFADPPTLGTTAAQVAPPAAVAATPPAAGSTRLSAGATPRGADGPVPVRHRSAHRGAAMSLADELNASTAASPRAVDNDSAKKRARTAPIAPAEGSRLLLDAGVPQLKLDMEEPVIPPTSGAPAAAPASSEADDNDLRQLRSLEQRLDSARRDAQAQHEQAIKLQAALAQAQSRSDSTGWLLGLLAVAAAAIAALVWKLRQQTRIAHSDWFNQSALGPMTAVPPVSELPPDPSAGPIPADELLGPVAPAPAPAEPPSEATSLPDPGDARGIPVVDHSATRPLARHAMAAAAQEDAPRELSVEELLDLEQQADFFIALGQEDAAVDLLMAHLRSAGGQSPLPYTKLLEIYRRQGDRAAYERTRARFNRRFNAYAPDWDSGPSSGRLLEDYPEAIAQLERAWHSPIDAMAILESLLFKRDEASGLFDLPAYRDVLVLYSLARDLWQHGGNAGAQVDVLLPLDDGVVATVSSPPAAGAAATGPGATPTPEPDAAQDDARRGRPSGFETTGFGAGGDSADLDLDLQPNADVHATLDELSLAPVAPTRPKPDPRDWRDAPDSEFPAKP